jgi:hypothetical protein
VAGFDGIGNRRHRLVSAVYALVQQKAPEAFLGTCSMGFQLRLFCESIE